MKKRFEMIDVYFIGSILVWAALVAMLFGVIPARAHDTKGNPPPKLYQCHEICAITMINFPVTFDVDQYCLRHVCKLYLNALKVEQKRSHSK